MFCIIIEGLFRPFHFIIYEYPSLALLDLLNAIFSALTDFLYFIPNRNESEFSYKMEA